MKAETEKLKMKVYIDKHVLDICELEAEIARLTAENAELRNQKKNRHDEVMLWVRKCDHLEADNQRLREALERIEEVWERIEEVWDFLFGEMCEGKR